MSKIQRRWTSHEDAALREHVQRQSHDGRSINWSEVAKAIPGRSNKDCRKRFFNKVTGGLKKGPWSEDEDARLEGFVKDHGTFWALIAQKMETRSADQCSKRWQHCLDPKLDHSVWTEQENMRLLLAVERHGTSWKEIQTEYFPFRSANNVKNQFTIIDRRSEKSAEAAPPSALPPQSSVDVTLPDLDFLDHSLADLSSMDTDHFANSSPFPMDDGDNSTRPDFVNAYSFDNCLNDDSLQLAASDTGSSSPYQMNTAPSSANASRRSSQISFSQKPLSSPIGCPLTRLGSQVPSLSTPHTATFPAGNNSNNNSDATGNGNSNSNGSNSCPLTRLGSQVPSRTTWNTITRPTENNSNSGLNNPPIAADNTMMPSIRPDSRGCNSHLTISPPPLGPSSNLPTPTYLQMQEPQYPYPTQPTSATASAPEPDMTDFDWPDLPSPPRSTAAENDNMRREGGGGSGGGNGSGSGTPGLGTRTTITLEGAEPEVIMNVMKVLVGSKTKVRFETN